MSWHGSRHVLILDFSIYLTYNEKSLIVGCWKEALSFGRHSRHLNAHNALEIARNVGVRQILNNIERPMVLL